MISDSKNHRKIHSSEIYVNVIYDDYYNYTDTNNIITLQTKITKGRILEDKSNDECGDSNIYTYTESTKYTKYIQSPPQLKKINFDDNNPLSAKRNKTSSKKIINEYENYLRKPLIKHFSLNSLKKLNKEKNQYINLNSVYNFKLLHSPLNNINKIKYFSPIINNANKRITERNYNSHFNYYSPENNILNSYNNQLSSDRRLNYNFSSDYIKFPINKKNKNIKSNDIINCINLKQNLKLKKITSYTPLIYSKLSSKREDKKFFTSRQDNWVNRLYTKELEKQKQRKINQFKKRKLILTKNNININKNKKVENIIKIDKINENKSDEDVKILDEIDKNEKLFEKLIIKRKKKKKNKENSLESDKKFIKKKSRNNKFDIDRDYEIKKLDKENIECLIQNDNVEKIKREILINKIIQELYMNEESIGEVNEDQEHDEE